MRKKKQPEEGQPCLGGYGSKARRTSRLTFGEIVNKWQIICPLAAIALVIIVFAMVSGANHRRCYIQAQTRMIGQELIATTNSTRLVQVGSGLQKRLSEILALPAGVADVTLGDEPSPIGDGTASSRLVVSNASGGRLGIRLRQDSQPERFHVLGFWTITEPDGSANGRQPFSPGNKSNVIGGWLPSLTFSFGPGQPEL